MLSTNIIIPKLLNVFVPALENVSFAFPSDKMFVDLMLIFDKLVVLLNALFKISWTPTPSVNVFLTDSFLKQFSKALTPIVALSAELIST